MKQKTALKVIALCNLVLYLKYALTVSFQGVRRTRAPEDGFQPSAIADDKKKALTSSDGSGGGKVEFSEEKRWQRIVLNDLENVLMGIVMMWLSYFVAGDYLVTAICGTAFTVARCLHTLCYVFQLMPWRAICWFVGVLSTLALTLNIVYGAFKN